MKLWAVSRRTLQQLGGAACLLLSPSYLTDSGI